MSKPETADNIRALFDGEDSSFDNIHIIENGLSAIISFASKSLALAAIEKINGQSYKGDALVLSLSHGATAKLHSKGQEGDTGKLQAMGEENKMGVPSLLQQIHSLSTEVRQQLVQLCTGSSSQGEDKKPTLTPDGMQQNIHWITKENNLRLPTFLGESTPGSVSYQQ